jgi:hypothetical protein
MMSELTTVGGSAYRQDRLGLYPNSDGSSYNLSSYVDPPTVLSTLQGDVQLDNLIVSGGPEMEQSFALISCQSHALLW